jgi:hypothetical protein
MRHPVALLTVTASTMIARFNCRSKVRCHNGVWKVIVVWVGIHNVPPENNMGSLPSNPISQSFGFSLYNPTEYAFGVPTLAKDARMGQPHLYDVLIF